MPGERRGTTGEADRQRAVLPASQADTARTDHDRRVHPTMSGGPGYGDRHPGLAAPRLDRRASQRHLREEMPVMAEDRDMAECRQERPGVDDGRDDRWRDGRRRNGGRDHGRRRGRVDRLDPVDGVDRHRVGLGAVGAGAAVDDVADAVAGEQRVVALLAVQDVAAGAAVQRSLPAAGERVVAVASGDQVRSVASGDRVVARAAVNRQERQRRETQRPTERVIAAEAVDVSRSALRSTENGTRFVRWK